MQEKFCIFSGPQITPRLDFILKTFLIAVFNAERNFTVHPAESLGGQSPTFRQPNLLKKNSTTGR
jgi:hypothetical protein